MHGAIEFARRVLVADFPEFDAVVIGRNEAATLQDALARVQRHARRLIYVDSGSTDNSVALARSAGAEVLELSPDRPFSAARARNEGFAALGEDGATLVQFLDCDCLLRDDWFDTARAFLAEHPRAALVYGHYSEAAPEASSYNWLTHWEWQKPTGPEAGGIGTFMARRVAFAESGGFRDDMIAAEDDELFLRLRAKGWQTCCIAAPMCVHDVGLHSFGPWYRRMVRAGHSFAELGVLHPGAARASRLRAYLWAGVLPLAGLGALIVWPPALLAVLGLYLVSSARQVLRIRDMGADTHRAVHVAALLMVSKFANLLGISKYWLRRLRRRGAELIEYK